MRLAFGGLIAVILLALYATALAGAIDLAVSDSTSKLNPGFAATISTVGGLVSALVVAVLAITKPGQAPVVNMLATGSGTPPSPTAEKAVAIVSALYVLVWIGFGVAAYVVGAMWHPGKVQPLTDFGQAWLGLAVAAAYAYFGLSR